MKFRPFAASLALVSAVSAEPANISGIYPSLSFFNDEGECGTGAVVPWAGSLWAVTYAPHSPKGSSDKLYQISPDLKLTVREESTGGTPANRMIHEESGQLFIGPYAIGKNAEVRTIPYSKMFGRPTGNARHLTDPAGKIYYATMEEGIYEVDVKTLEVTELFADEQKKEGRHAALPGYHGKGLYSGHGRLIYANNGDHAAEALKRPDVPSGVLASWDGKSEKFEIIRRNQFTEVTGPGGIRGNKNPDKDPIWAMGWDHRSLILMLLDGGKWTSFRMPKGSHSYDGAHGWNTEWPRIREIGGGSEFLATMHGTFWKFPKTFSARNTAGISPRSNYLKVIGDFCQWNGRIVFGCDDTAKNEFLNKRKAKGEIAAPQSQSNLWFVEAEKLDHLGPVIGRGALWFAESVEANKATDPYLIAGYERKGLHLAKTDAKPAVITVEIDRSGTGAWTKTKTIDFPGAYKWVDLSELKGEWIRLSSSVPMETATASFIFGNADKRPEKSAAMFDGLATASEKNLTGGIVRALPDNKRTLSFAATGPGGAEIGGYELDADLQLKPTEDTASYQTTKKNAKIPVGSITVDAASVVFTDDNGKKWRLPKGDAALDAEGPLGASRGAREVATERDLFHAHGSFYELPANNAGGFTKVRPIATHNLRINDFCSFRGLFVMSGIANDAPKTNKHIVRSSDGKTALWVGAIDDVWAMGKPRGTGGPWKDTAVKAGEASDPYLMTAYDQKTLTLASDKDSTVTVEVDLTGDGKWAVYADVKLTAGKPETHKFPAAFSAYWIRFTSSENSNASAQLEYK